MWQSILTTFLLLSHCFANLPADPHIDWVDCHKHVPRPLLQAWPQAQLKSLPTTLQCGRIAVPMSYEKPAGPTNNITLGLAMYRPRNPKGVLF